ncbi:MAG: bifunctional DNA-formamidopyrimidine glycosylase/DNA-(apurinic or apyrimidinic site) lyase [Terriglobales bacterium]
MPELPEVETVARGLQKRVAGDVIESVWISGKKQPLKSSPEEIVAALEGSRIVQARRVGKHIAIDLERASEVEGTPAAQTGVSAVQTHQWIVHLGMTGSMLVTSPDAPIEKHTHLIAKMQSGKEVRFVDPRMFGKLAVTQEQFKAPGSEPLDIDFESLVKLFRKRKTPIKSALLNQSLLSGVGNIYADESLARAGIRPKRRAASLTRAELKKLYDGLKKVLHEAIKAGGSSVSDYVDADGERGFFQFKHLVYGREGQPCRKCKTPIKRIVIAGRSSHYCPKCQK